SEPKVCDDQNACTEDTCDPESGACRFTPLTSDRDGDGFPAPREGFARTDPAACGTDCDDNNERIFPGNREVCDGFDNDCDGVVDNGANFVANPSQLLDLSSAAQRAVPGGIAYSGDVYGAVFSQKIGGAANTQNTFASISPAQTGAPPLVPVAL